MKRKSAAAVLVFLAIMVGLLTAHRDDSNPGRVNEQPSYTEGDKRTRHPETRGSKPELVGSHRITGVRIVNSRDGRTVFAGEVNIKPVLDRIARGERDSHPNDGAVYRNLNRLLPSRPIGYYREYVVPTKGLRGAGPQRLVIGRKGEVYYTWDHYDTFITVQGE